MIYVTGDCHGDFKRFTSKNFPEQYHMTRDDFVIILGDFGGIWRESKEELYWLDWLNNKPFTTLFIDGNHENFDLLKEYPVVDFAGGKAHRIMDNIYHLMRGYVFEIDGSKFFAFGGASSHDIEDGILDPADYSSNEAFKQVYNNWCRQNKMFRVKGVSWWEEEIASDEEMLRGKDNLAANNNEVDFVITHCCPQHVATLISHGQYKPDKMTKYFNEISEKTKFKKWFFGHYHGNLQVMVEYIELYEQIIRVA